MNTPNCLFTMYLFSDSGAIVNLELLLLISFLNTAQAFCSYAFSSRYVFIKLLLRIDNWNFAYLLLKNLLINLTIFYILFKDSKIIQLRKRLFKFFNFLFFQHIEGIVLPYFFDLFPFIFRIVKLSSVFFEPLFHRVI